MRSVRSMHSHFATGTWPQISLSRPVRARLLVVLTLDDDPLLNPSHTAPLSAFARARVPHAQSPLHLRVFSDVLYRLFVDKEEMGKFTVSVSLRCYDELYK